MIHLLGRSSAHAGCSWTGPLAIAASATATAAVLAGEGHGRDVVIVQSHILGRSPSALCESSSSRKRPLEKRQSLQQAVQQKKLLRRLNTKEELDKLRPGQSEMLKRWERDEDGWRELPARAWPAYQPDEEELVSIQAQVTENRCISAASMNNTRWWRRKKKMTNTASCTDLLFNVATANVFNTLNPAAGLKQYEVLANEGHVDSMVACGVILVEGLGVPPNEAKGVEWLRKAVKLGSSQAMYELGTVYYTGIDGVVEEDPVAAFELFEQASKHNNHTSATYMMADCLLEGEGTEKDVARAIPLLYQAADRGHRFARQRIRELLKKQK